MTVYQSVDITVLSIRYHSTKKSLLIARKAMDLKLYAGHSLVFSHFTWKLRRSCVRKKASYAGRANAWTQTLEIFLLTPKSVSLTRVRYNQERKKKQSLKFSAESSFAGKTFVRELNENFVTF